MSLELERLNWNIAGLEAQSMLARVCVPAPKPVAANPLIDRRWFMACVYVVVAMVIGALILMVVV